MTTKFNGVVAAAVSVLLAASAIAASPSNLRGTQTQATISNDTNGLVAADGKANVIIIFKQQPGTLAYASALHQGGGGALAEAAANSAAKTAVTAATQQQNAAAAALQRSGIQYQELYRVQRVLNGIALRVAPADMQALRGLPGVERVEFLPLEHPSTGFNISLINAPELWEGTPLGTFAAKGEHIRIGIIDTGIDYVHPNFGGTGTLAAYQNIVTTSTMGVDNSTVFPTAKVVGGTDLAGDAYTGGNTPVPDANPMDCNGHGSHVAGIAAGYGVNPDGSSYTGPWNTTPNYTGFRIAPGVAPLADLYAIRVFGCGGSTGLTVDAIEWAMDPNGDMDFSDRLDVINMSLGSDYGLPFDSSAVAADNASSTGMIVVASAGNAGDTFYIHGSPAGGNSAIAVASTQDSGQMGPLLVNAPAPIAGYYTVGTAQFGTSVPLAGLTGNVVRVDDGVAAATINDGCETPFVNAAAVTGNIALIDRGTCGFKLKAHNAQLNGAVAVIIANVASSGNPTVAPGMADDPTVAAVTIPVVSLNLADGNTLRSNLVSLNVTLTNGADTISSFTSRGPFGADGTVYLKPDLAAPGSNIVSTQTGITCKTTGAGCLTPNASGFIANGASLILSGTSMASPHVAGLMALIRQLNPSASVEELKALAMNTAGHDISVGPAGLLGTFGASRVGSGRIDAALAATDDVIAFNADVAGAVSVTFDTEVIGTASATHNVRIENHTAAPQAVTLSLDPVLASPGVQFSIVGASSISLPPSGSVTVQVKMDATGDLMKRSLDPTMAATSGMFSPFTNIAATLPRDYIAESASLLKVFKNTTELARLPVYMIHRPHSDMHATVATAATTASGSVNVSLAGTDVCTGTRGTGTCTGDFGTTDELSLVSPFELQYTGSVDDSLPGFANLKYVGINYDSTNDEYLFGLSTFGKWGSPTDVAFDVCIDTDKDGKYDKVLFNSNTGTEAQRVFATAGASGQDVFISSVFTPPTSVTFLSDFANTETADDVDSALHDNNVIVVGGYATNLGVAAGGASFNYAIAVCPGFNPLCVTLGDANRTCSSPNAYAVIPNTFTYNGANPGLVTGGGAFFGPIALVPDLAGTNLAVDYDFTKTSANGSAGTLLLLHHHNDGGNSAEVVVLDRIFSDGFGN